MANLCVFIFVILMSFVSSFHEEESDSGDVKDLKFETVTLTTTRTYTVWKTSTSDVKITSAVLVPLTVTQYSTSRDFEKEDPDTVTSFVRITKTPIVKIAEEETQTLVQVEYETVTSFSSVLVTKLPSKFGFAFGY
ncbi:hypothetical protein Anas_05706 [Armadillidium nasatum]|uniref:Uncharacterized protein n=1 Tax=Armadillidium nasatum TaxID=96803 RepID=A0A5N5TGG7_9CRUS|nr:hypothetical protein Anas_05706 [Armadillidium nasatum]